MRRNASSFISTAVLALPLLLAACSDGGGSGNRTPVAFAGPDQLARTLSNVLLSGRDSDDPDGPVMEYEWRIVGVTPATAQVIDVDTGPAAPVNACVDSVNTAVSAAVKCVPESRSTVRFNAPRVSEETVIEFELRVVDAEGAVGTDRMTVTVSPVADPDRALLFLAAPGHFTVVAATRADHAPGEFGGNDRSFDLVVETRATYPDVAGAIQSRITRTHEISGRWLAQTGSARDRDHHANPRYTFPIPTASKDELPGVDESLLDQVELEITVHLDSPDGLATYLYVLDETEPEHQVIAEDGDTGGTASLLTLPVTDLTGMLAIRPVENRLTAEAYYRAVDPAGRKTTLSDWKAENGFGDGAGEEHSARYINSFDLAFGRRMFVRVDGNGNVASYVENYPTMDALQAGTFLIASVAMEYSPAPCADYPDDYPGKFSCDPDRKYTKFYTFVPEPATGEQRRTLSQDFDTRGEKFQPGVCMGCHGGVPPVLGSFATDGGGNLVYPNFGDVSARFLPWDVDSFTFSDREFEGQGRTGPVPGFTRAEQQQAFKAFNRIVLDHTDPSDVQRELIEGWYGGEGMPSDVFNGGFTPAGWLPESLGGPLGNPDDSEDLYHAVAGPACRACHSVRDSSAALSFSSYTAFNAFATSIRSQVFDRGTMPMARRTMDDLWVHFPDGIQRLAAHLGVDPDENRPGRPIAAIALTGPSQGPFVTGDTVRLSGRNSLFASSYHWTLTPPDGSAVVLVGDGTREPAFRVDIPGDYTVRLTVGDGVQESAADERVFEIGAAVVPVSFTSDVNPIFAAQGCTGCHISGHVSGMNLTQTAANNCAAINSGRVNLASPASSLILRKPNPNDALSHDGGKYQAFESPSGAAYAVILQWIQEGAQCD